MTLDDLVKSLELVGATGSLDRPIERVTHDSRDAGPDDVFVAIRGQKLDGRSFVPGLRVAAVIADAPVEADPGVAILRVPDARKAMARTAAFLAGFPSRDLPVIGITGTNGKTTVTWMLESIARAADRTAGVIGTTGHRIAGQSLPATHTTPEAPVLQDLLARMRDAGCALAAVEISSIGLDQHRVDDIELATGVFTSFSQDHLDFHLTMEAYLAAKLRMFSDLLRPDGTAVVAGADPVAQDIVDAAGRRQVWRYGRKEHFDIAALDVKTDDQGSHCRVITPAGAGRLHLPMPGLYNLDNALGALGAALSVGIPFDAALDGLQTLPAVPGRMERVPDPTGDRVVVVDYAHTPDALARALSAARKLAPGRLHVVFGCGGDRDQAKRPAMGHVASMGADRIWLTSDNPRQEDPDRILAEIQAGTAAAAPGSVDVEVDRRTAITRALQDAEPGDVVLIAGKGHETTQTIGDTVRAFDDRVVAAELLAQAAGGDGGPPT